MTARSPTSRRPVRRSTAGSYERVRPAAQASCPPVMPRASRSAAIRAPNSTAMGVCSIGDGVWTLERRKAWKLPWQRQRQRWQPEGWRKIVLGIFAVLIGLPRLAGGSALLVLVFTGVALIPMAWSLVLLGQARPPLT